MLMETPQHTRLLRDNNRFFLIIENLMADDVMRFFIFLLHLIINMSIAWLSTLISKNILSDNIFLR